MSLDVNSLSFLNTQRGRQNAEMVAVPAVLAAGSTFLATKAPQGAKDSVKFTTRLSKAGKAGLATAMVMGVLANKDKIGEIGSNIINKFKGLSSNRTDDSKKQPEEISQQQTTKTQEEAPAVSAPVEQNFEQPLAQPALQLTPSISEFVQ